MIVEALRQSDAKDYSSEVIDRVESSFSPSALLNLFEQREVFIAVHEHRIVGTASLDPAATGRSRCHASRARAASNVSAVWIWPWASERAIG